MLLLEIESGKELENLKPDFSVLRNIETSISGVLVTAKSIRENFDYEYRYFFPCSLPFRKSTAASLKAHFR